MFLIHFVKLECNIDAWIRTMAYLATMLARVKIRASRFSLIHPFVFENCPRKCSASAILKYFNPGGSSKASCHSSENAVQRRFVVIKPANIKIGLVGSL